MNEKIEELIYDWNVAAEQPVREAGRKIEFDDETLRDGLQSPSVTDPTLDEKVRILHYMNDIGVDSADIGLPGAGPHVQRSVEWLAREIVDRKLTVAANCAARKGLVVELDLPPCFADRLFGGDVPVVDQLLDFLVHAPIPLTSGHPIIFISLGSITRALNEDPVDHHQIFAGP